MWSTSRKVPLRRSGAISAARAMLVESADSAAVPPASCRNRRRFTWVMARLPSGCPGSGQYVRRTWNTLSVAKETRNETLVNAG